MPVDYIPVLIQIAIIMGFGVFVLVLTHLVGPKNKDPEKLDVYECGVPVYSGVPMRFSVKFYLVAMIFVLFDIEAIFLYPLAVIFKPFLAIHGVFIFVEMITFVGILFVGLAYVWKRGALDWE